MICYYRVLIVCVQLSAQMMQYRYLDNLDVHVQVVYSGTD